MSNTTRYTIFVHLTALPAWLALSREQRHQVIGQHVQPLLEKHADVSLRWFDAEALSASSSDVLMASTDDLRSWSDLMEGLRDSLLWSAPSFRVDLVLPTLEDGYADYEQREGLK
ncbi:darcynin family protein [Nocardia sp. NPDC004123]